MAARSHPPLPPAGPGLSLDPVSILAQTSLQSHAGFSAEVKELTVLPSSDDKSVCLSFLLGFSIYVVIDDFAPNSSDFNLD